MILIQTNKTKKVHQANKEIFTVIGIIVMVKFKAEIGVISMIINVSSVEEKFAGSKKRRKKKRHKSNKILQDGIVIGAIVMEFLKEEVGVMLYNPNVQHVVGRYVHTLTTKMIQLQKVGTVTGIVVLGNSKEEIGAISQSDNVNHAEGEFAIGDH